jgi:DNA-binding CsgD family transcriptional regulator
MFGKVVAFRPTVGVESRQGVRLTPAEGAVLSLIIDGRSNAEAARARGVAIRTVANQVSALLHKLGVGSRRELAASAAHSSAATGEIGLIAAIGLLTERERQVTALAALGQSNKRIASALGVSVSTVGTHLAAGARKLGVPSGAALAHQLSGIATTGSWPSAGRSSK